jgi:uncharacterized iron-regulated membrane protein
MRASTLQTFRQIHLCLGLFTAPAILFFALSGILQTFSLHDVSKDGTYKPATWIVRLAQIHKKQTAELPVPKSLAAVSAQTGARVKVKQQKPLGQAETPVREVHNTLPLKIFFLIVGLALCMSTMTGVYMSWKYRRSKVLQVALLLAGIVVPVVLMVV